MTYRDVTLAPDDIEWFTKQPSNELLKDAVFNQSVFDRLIADTGLDEALKLFTRLHRAVANQLIEYAVDDPDASDWGRRTIALCFRLKKRRNQLRGMLRARDGWDAVAVVVARYNEWWPRAVWGVKTMEGGAL